MPDAGARRGTVSVRRITDGELPAFVDALSTGFLDRPDVDRIATELRPLWDLERVWAAFDGKRVCGTLRSWATEVTLPGGGRVPAGALSAVTVLPTHRRRGVLTSMIAAEHGAMRERGEPVSLLYASEYPIYGRFGYGPACRTATWTLDAASTAFHREAGGTVELATPGEASREMIKRVFEDWRARQPGEIRRRDFRWDFDLGLRESAWDPRWKGFLALHRTASGAVDGYVRYRAEERWEQRQPRAVLNVDDLHALTDDAYLGLWRFLASVDLVSTIKAERRRVDERLPWLLTNARAASVGDVGDGMWARLLDVPRALEARAYERDGRAVLEVVDPEATGGRLRVALDVADGRARCRPSKAAPDLTVGADALGAAYLGGTRLRDAALRGGVEEHRRGALARVDGLLATLDEPWCSTFF